MNPAELPYSFMFDERTEFGQDVLELSGIVASLMDPNEVYTKIDVNMILNEVEQKAHNMRLHWMPTRDERRERR